MKKSKLSSAMIRLMEKVNSGEHLSAFENLHNPFFSGKEQLIQLVPYNTFKWLVDHRLLYKSELQSGDGRFYFLPTEDGKKLGI